MHARMQQVWTLVNKTEGAVMGPYLAGKHGIQSGFEGGQYFRTDDGVYHYFATEMVRSGAEMWVGTRGGHWTAIDPSIPEVPAFSAPCPPCPPTSAPSPPSKAGGWQRQGTLFNSSGIYDGSDRSGAKWAPARDVTGETNAPTKLDRWMPRAATLKRPKSTAM